KEGSEERGEGAGSRRDLGHSGAAEVARGAAGHHTSRAWGARWHRNESRAASGAGFTPAKRAGGLGGAPLAPPSSKKQNAEDPRHRRRAVHARAALHHAAQGGVRRPPRRQPRDP